MKHDPNLLKVALIGNPNSGKSTVFNQLTGMRQKTGNFPGVTVEVKEGKLSFPSGQEVLLVDLPGTYSLYPTSSDEKIVAPVLTDPHSPFFPDAVLYVADATHIEKHLLLLTQLMDLNLPVVLALNMMDTAAEHGIKVNEARLSERLGIPVVPISGRTGDNIQKLIGEVEKLMRHSTTAAPADAAVPAFYTLTDSERQVAEAVRLNLGTENPYRALLLAHHHAWLAFLPRQERDTLAAIVQTKEFQSLRAQVDETLDRYDRFTPIVQDAVQQPPSHPDTPTDRIDAVLTHRVAGPLIFVGVMLLVFQAIFDWSDYPMTMIEDGFGALNEWIKARFPAHWATDLLTDGILTGLSGILVFVPQIALLFFLISMLEELGYMARVVFMFDRMMRRFGMNGRSVVSLISGGACAVPAIMSSRTIGSWQERIITIMVTPFISCSARIPVYLVLIGLAVPSLNLWGIFNARTLVFAALYFLGILTAFAVGWAMKKWLRSRERSYLAIELPEYRMPHWRNVWLTVWEKTLSFIVGAGKIILYVSIALWAMSRFGPGDSMQRAQEAAAAEAAAQSMDTTATKELVAQRLLESSYAGYMGRFIEPAIRPLGYDWKIGIALLTSFAAREVFTGTLAVLYHMGEAEGDINDRSENAAKATLREKMKAERYRDTGQPVYTLATALSLLVFYALAMQCFSTLVTVRRETGSWRWALFQFVLMSSLAYLGAWAVYAVFS
ncbi:MAG TPA: ferrous iron transport protein B [Saprospiraceae bacterium]|nr:ferrous iron transport protein B [Saprospiraceae bacterium]